LNLSVCYTQTHICKTCS